MLALDVLDDPCIFVAERHGRQLRRRADRRARVRRQPRTRRRRRALDHADRRRVREPPLQGAALPDVDDPAVGRQGAAQHPAHRRRPAARSDGTFNTDTLIVVSIDPTTKQVAMFSLPRDIVDVPLPPGPARTSSARPTPARSTALVTTSGTAPTSSRATTRPAATTRLKAVLGKLYGLDIKYFVEVNFDGFKKVVDALGGVTINVQVPVLDDQLPGRHGPARTGSTSRPASST